MRTSVFIFTILLLVISPISFAFTCSDLGNALSDVQQAPVTSSATIVNGQIHHDFTKRQIQPNPTIISARSFDEISKNLGPATRNGKSTTYEWDKFTLEVFPDFTMKSGNFPKEFTDTTPSLSQLIAVAGQPRQIIVSNMYTWNCSTGYVTVLTDSNNKIEKFLGVSAKGVFAVSIADLLNIEAKP